MSQHKQIWACVKPKSYFCLFQVQREDATIVSLRPKKKGCESVNISTLVENELDEMEEVDEAVMS